VATPQARLHQLHWLVGLPVSAIIHQKSIEENLELFRKVFRYLNQGGRVAIRGHVMEPERTHPKECCLFAVNMLIGTRGGGET